MELVIEDFKKRISKHLNFQLDLVINENRSTMLNVLEKTRHRVRLSMHRMFLDAPEDVISALAHYVRGARSSKLRDFILRGYIQSNLSRYNYSHTVNRTKLITFGKVYDLQKIYQELNAKYFDNALDLGITWYGKGKQKSRCRVVFGQYYDHLKLIKIHRMLDDPFFPDFFVTFVVYHEMLHEVVPGYVDEKGIFRSHGEEFKKREKQFADYQQAITWEKNNKQHLFI